MKYTVRTLQKYRIAYGLLPFKRNQDVIKIHEFSGGDYCAAVGSVIVLTWDGHHWMKPEEIGDYSLDANKYPSDVSMFFGRGELKTDPLYSCHADVLRISSQTPILLASDGLEKVLNNRDINAFSVNPTKQSAKEIVETILHEVTRRDTQRDDISLLVRV